MSAASPDLIVVGGGVVGTAIAYFAARDGLSVALLERGELAGQASGAAAGMLRPLGEQRGRDAFRAVGLRSLGMFPELCAELRERSGIDPELVESGVLDLAFDEDAARELEAQAGELREHGVEWLDADAARAAEPQLAPGVRGALWSPREAHVRSPLLVRAFAAAAEGLGARVERGVEVIGLTRSGARVTGVRTRTGDRSASTVILCTGAWTAVCAGWLGSRLRLPIEPVRGQILALDAPRPPVHAMLTGAGVYLVPKRDGSLVVGATQERVGFECRVTARGLAELLGGAPRCVPATAQCGFRYAWAGLRPATPDALPLVGPLPGVEGLALAAGHFRNGVLLAPVTARLIVDLVAGKGLPPEAAAFDPARFSGGDVG